LRFNRRKRDVLNILNKNSFLIAERAGLLKSTINYDILDPETNKVLMESREETPGRFVRFLRMTDCRRTTPFDFHIASRSGEKILQIKRDFPIFGSKVMVFDEQDVLIGCFAQRSLFFRVRFDVLDANGDPLCFLESDLAGSVFRFLAPGDEELARTTRKWGGLKREIFTSADNYLLKIDEAVPENSVSRQLILASVVCMDMVIKS